MSPLEIRRLVGHPDIVERLRDDAVDTANWRHTCLNAADEISRLRSTLRAVRGSSDPAWQARLIDEALGETTP